MKNIFLTLAAIAFLSTAAVAADTPAAAPAAADKAAAKEAKFDARKKKIADKISARLAELQKRQECVNAATTADALKACKPARHKCGGDE